MQKPWLTIRHFMAIAMLITSVQSVMAMPVAQEMVMPNSDNPSAISITNSGPVAASSQSHHQSADASSQHKVPPCCKNCCCDDDCGDHCNEMSGNSCNCTHLSSLLLPHFELKLIHQVAFFHSTEVTVAELAPLPPTKPPV